MISDKKSDKSQTKSQTVTFLHSDTSDFLQQSQSDKRHRVCLTCLTQKSDQTPALIIIMYQITCYSMACIEALEMKRGGPGSERSCHINIRYFWLSDNHYF